MPKRHMKPGDFAEKLRIIPAPYDPEGPALVLHLIPKPLMDGYIKIHLRSRDDLHELADYMASLGDALFPSKPSAIPKRKDNRPR